MSRADTTIKEQPPVTELRARSTFAYQVLTAVTLAACAGLIAYFLMTAGGHPVPATTQVGRIYGLAGTVLMAVLAAYGVRRYAYHARYLRLEWWYRAHLVLGLLTLTLLGCHSGFAFRSVFLGVLQVSFWGAILTGLFGWGYQSALRNWMVRHEHRPTILRELDECLAETRAEVQKQIAALDSEAALAGGLSLQKLLAHVLDRLRQSRVQNVWRFPDHSYWDRQVRTLLLKQGLSDLPPDVQGLIIDLNHLEVLRWNHVVLRAWTTLHFWFTFLAVQMMIWHIWLVGRHPR